MNDREEVLAVLRRITDAWNSGDAAAYARQFTADADYVTWFGMRFTGRAAIESSHRELFEGPLRGSKLSSLDEAEVRFPLPDTAIVVSGGGSSLTGRDPVDEGRVTTVTFVLIRDSEGWVVTAFQNTRVTDPRVAA
ncbi:SgcJ/EcaC family oxidoreductase [Amycolatopsis ultiminotia]|uniref:SgcJ/EcaC family oxidoreductase n=1 Tax=Amycolatopsis ultiminotia TaxID=543629 RepID=A0ABP6X536_9PSEU